MKKIFYYLYILPAFLCSICFAKTNIPVTFSHDGFNLSGRLTLPNGTGRFQTIIIIPGSGANDKDGTIPMYGANIACLYPALLNDTLRPYKGLSEALSDSGYAVFTYDKIEYTYPATLGVITFHKLWLPVESALSFLKTRNEVDTNNIIILGHSEGSTLAPHIAKNNPGVKALISLAGPRRSVYDTILAYQLKNIATTCNGDTTAAINQGNQLIAYFNLIRTGNWNSSTPSFAGVPASVWADYIKVADSVAINYNIAHKKTLFIGLGNDINVPVNTELHQFVTAINIPATFYEVPGLNHYLTTSANPATAEILTDTIVYWLRHNVFPTAIKETRLTQQNISLETTNGKWMVTAYSHPIDAVKIYDLNGRLVYQSKPETARYLIDEQFSKGIYVLLVQSGSFQKTFKISY